MINKTITVLKNTWDITYFWEIILPYIIVICKILILRNTNQKTNNYKFLRTYLDQDQVHHKLQDTYFV